MKGDYDATELEEAVLEGAKLAHQRIQACLRGDEKTVSEQEIMALLESDLKKSKDLRNDDL